MVSWWSCRMKKAIEFIKSSATFTLQLYSFSVMKWLRSRKKGERMFKMSLTDWKIIKPMWQKALLVYLIELKFLDNFLVFEGKNEIYENSWIPDARVLQIHQIVESLHKRKHIKMNQPDFHNAWAASSPEDQEALWMLLSPQDRKIRNICDISREAGVILPSLQPVWDWNCSKLAKHEYRLEYRTSSYT